MKHNCVFLYFVFIGFVCQLQAQDNPNYNNLQFGIKGLLTSGAMIAGDEDASMVYYNPAAIGFQEGKALDIALLVPNFKFATLENGFGTGTAVRTGLLFKMIPGFVSFKLDFIKNKKFSLSAALLNKDEYYNGFNFSKTMQLENGNFLNSNLRYDQEVNSLWFGVGSSYAFNKHFSIGLSQFMTFRNLSYSHNLVQIEQADETQFDFINRVDERLQLDLAAIMGFVTKLGLAYRNDFLNIGVTLTTPTYGYPLRKAVYNYSTSLVKKEENINRAVAYRNEVNNTIKTPFSVGVGFAFKIKDRGRISINGEYFGKIKPYEILSQQESNANFVVRSAKKQVLNAAIGWEFKLSEKVSYLGGFSTSFNADRTLKDSEIQLFSNYWNIYRLSNGVKLNIKHNIVMAGLRYGFSFQSLEGNYINLSRFNENGSNDQTGSSAKVSYNDITLLITYSFLLDVFKKRDKKKATLAD